MPRAARRAAATRLCPLNVGGTSSAEGRSQSGRYKIVPTECGRYLEYRGPLTERPLQDRAGWPEATSFLLHEVARIVGDFPSDQRGLHLDLR